jgi:3-oxoacid CoA-transferase subunit A
MDKVISSIDEAVADIPNGASIAMGGFFACGTPVFLTKALARRNPKDLTLILLSAGVGNIEVNELIENDQVRRVIASYPFFRSVEKGRQHIFEQMARTGKIVVDVYPMGTFSEMLRAAGAGIAGFYTRAGVGTVVAQGKETKVFDGKTYLLERAVKPDYAFIHAWKADREGNCFYRKTARSFNPVMAMAAGVTIVETENLVDVGSIDADQVHTPGVYVQRVVKVDRPKVYVGID